MCNIVYRSRFALAANGKMAVRGWLLGRFV